MIEILFLDDDNDFRHLMEIWLTGLHFSVVAFERGSEAVIEIVSRARDKKKLPDVAILDCSLQRFDGFTVAKLIRIIESTVPGDSGMKIAFLTGYTEFVE